MKKAIYNFTVNNIPKWAEFDWIDIQITNSLIALENLFSLQNESYANVEAELNQSVKNEEQTNSEMSEQDLETYLSHLFEIEKTVTFEINRAQQFSQVLILFSIFESKLNLICGKIEDDFGISLGNIKANTDISKYRKFLVIFLDERFKDVEKMFDFIYKQYPVRNIIAHQNGIADIKKFNQLKSIKTISFYNFEESYYISIPDNNFISELLLLMKRFFFLLLKAFKLRTNEKLS